MCSARSVQNWSGIVPSAFKNIIPASTPNMNDGIMVNSDTFGNLEPGKGHLGSHRNWAGSPSIAILLVTWSGITVNSNTSGHLERDHCKWKYFWSLGVGSP